MGILSKKTGVYETLFRPRYISELACLDTVRIKPEWFFEQYKTNIGIVIGDLKITEDMQEYFGKELEVIEVDDSDDTFKTIIGPKAYWWPFSTIDYIDRS